MSAPHYAHGILSNEEVDILNAARNILQRCTESLSRPSNAPEGTRPADLLFAGRAAQAADYAHDLVRDFLIAVRSYVDVPITEEQISNSHRESFGLLAKTAEGR